MCNLFFCWWVTYCTVVAETAMENLQWLVLWTLTSQKYWTSCFFFFWLELFFVRHITEAMNAKMIFFFFFQNVLCLLYMKKYNNLCILKNEIIIFFLSLNYFKKKQTCSDDFNQTGGTLILFYFSLFTFVCFVFFPHFMQFFMNFRNQCFLPFSFSHTAGKQKNINSGNCLNF